MSAALAGLPLFHVYQHDRVAGSRKAAQTSKLPADVA